MLLIGSRAIRYHFPEARAPGDWSAVATSEEIADLKSKLPCLREGKRKSLFVAQSELVEVHDASIVPHWGKILSEFAQEPSISPSPLGPLHVPPPSYLMLAKQCTLVFRIPNWHETLEEFLFLRARIATLPSMVEHLRRDCLEYSRSVLGHPHLQTASPPVTCHPSTPPPRDEETHALLHRCLAGVPSSPHPMWRGWQECADAPSEVHRELMIRVAAEEAQVVAAERILGDPIPELDAPAALQFALRELAVGELPELWRCFVVHQFRAISGAIPENWAGKLYTISNRRLRAKRPCQTSSPQCQGLY